MRMKMNEKKATNVLKAIVKEGTELDSTAKRAVTMFKVLHKISQTALCFGIKSLWAKLI